MNHLTTLKLALSRQKELLDFISILSRTDLEFMGDAIKKERTFRTSFSECPYEILLIIFSYLHDAKSITTISLVCKQWYKLKVGLAYIVQQQIGILLLKTIIYGAKFVERNLIFRLFKNLLLPILVLALIRWNSCVNYDHRLHYTP